MLRLLGALTLGNMIFGGHRCHCHHHRRHGSFLGGIARAPRSSSRVSRAPHAACRSILLGTLLGLFVSRANQNRTEEEV